MACSWDGSVAYIEFDDKELGQIVSVEEKENLFQRMYGKKSFSTGVDKKASIVIEDPDWIQPQLVEPTVPSIIEEDGGMLSSDSRASRSSQIVAKGPIDKQIETRTVDGRRRITPVFIPPPMEEDDAQSSHASNHSSAALVQPTFSSSTEARSKIVVEKRDEVTKPGLSSTTSTSPPPPQPNARKEMSNILLNRRLERNEPERRVVSVRTSGPSTASVSTTGVSIVRAPDSDKISISPLPVQKTFSIPVSCQQLFFNVCSAIYMV
jgi:protein HIRA/HIR1